MLVHARPAAGETIALAHEPRPVGVFELDGEVIVEVPIVTAVFGQSPEPLRAHRVTAKDPIRDVDAMNEVIDDEVT
jgi:hypothetical protein